MPISLEQSLQQTALLLSQFRYSYFRSLNLNSRSFEDRLDVLLLSRIRRGDLDFREVIPTQSATSINRSWRSTFKLPTHPFSLENRDQELWGDIGGSEYRIHWAHDASPTMVVQANRTLLDMVCCVSELEWSNDFVIRSIFAIDLFGKILVRQHEAVMLRA